MWTLFLVPLIVLKRRCHRGLPGVTTICWRFFWSADCKNRCIVLRGSELDKWVFVIIVYLQIRPVADEKRTICQLQLRDIVPMFSLGVLSSDMMSAGGTARESVRRVLG